MLSQRTIATIAIISVLVNTLLIGFIGAQWLRGSMGPPAWRVAQFATAGLPASATTAKLRAIIASEMSASAETRVAMLAARNAVLMALQAEPYDPAAAAAALTQSRVASQALLESFHRAIIAAAGSMTDDERAEMAVYLARLGPGGPGGPGGRGLGPPRGR